jgi:hypothetical protein
MAGASGDEGKLEPAAEYSPQSILVTGGAGFIASHVVDLLLRECPTARVR